MCGTFLDVVKKTERIKEPVKAQQIMLSCCEVFHTAHPRIAIISLIFQVNACYIIEYVKFYQISPKCFGAYCNILREKFVSLAQNYLLLFSYLVVTYRCIGFEQFMRGILIVVNCPRLLSIKNYEKKNSFEQVTRSSPWGRRSTHRNMYDRTRFSSPTNAPFY